MWAKTEGVRTPLLASSPMAYLKAGFLAMLAALVSGIATGAWRVLVIAVERLRPEDRAVVLAQGTSAAINDAALFAILMVPLGLLLVFAARRWRRRHSE